MSIHLMQWAEVPPQAWRNGGGTTRELLTWPGAGAAADWQVRVSVADITRDGPFSAFPGIHRAFTVLEGTGVALDFGAGEGTGLTTGGVRLTPGDGALEFDGALAPSCLLLDGPTRDLNLMVRQDVGRARMAPAHAGQKWMSPGPWRGLYTHGGATLQTSAGRLALPAGTLAWSDGGSSQPWQLIDGRNCWWLAAAPGDPA